MTKHEFRLVARTGGIEAVADGAEALDGEVGQQPFRRGVADDGDAVATLHTKRDQAAPDARDLVGKLQPFGLTIETAALGPKCSLRRSFVGDMKQQTWNCQQRLMGKIEPRPAKTAGHAGLARHHSRTPDLVDVNHGSTGSRAGPRDVSWTCPWAGIWGVAFFRSFDRKWPMSTPATARWEPTPRQERRSR